MGFKELVDKENNLNKDSADLKNNLILKGAELIRKGGIVAFPTETVYGLGANAFNSQAVHKIFEAKGRPADNPLIVHIADSAQVKELVSYVPPNAEKLMRVFWPGPLTIILPKSDKVPPVVSAGLDTVAIRMPNHSIALNLIEASGLPIAAPSANISGKPSPTTAEHVQKDLAGKVDMILDGGETNIGLESTVLDLTSNPPVVLRPGGVTVEELQQVLGEVKAAQEDNKSGSIGSAPKSPGMKYTHYSPDAQLIIVQGSLENTTAKIKQLQEHYQRVGNRVGILATRETIFQYNSNLLFSMGSRQNLKEIAANLYDLLRKFDQVGADIILAEALPTTGIGLAIMNRLRKASGYHIIRV